MNTLLSIGEFSSGIPVIPEVTSGGSEFLMTAGNVVMEQPELTSRDLSPVLQRAIGRVAEQMVTSAGGNRNANGAKAAFQSNI